MSTKAVSYSTQIGQWDQPQIISFDSLFEKYSVESNFEREDVAKINSVVNQWKPFVQEFIYQPASYRRPCLSDYLEKQSNPKMDINITRRTAHVEHPGYSLTSSIRYNIKPQGSTL